MLLSHIIRQNCRSCFTNTLYYVVHSMNSYAEPEDCMYAARSFQIFDHILHCRQQVHAFPVDDNCHLIE